MNANVKTVLLTVCAGLLIYGAIRAIEYAEAKAKAKKVVAAIKDASREEEPEQLGVQD